ncbi:MAG: L,D-transpeptidase family protein [Acidobacteriota bacterium]
MTAVWLGVFLTTPGGKVAPNPAPVVSSAVVGSEFTYAVQKGDSLTRIGARFGAEVPALAELNGLKPTARLKLGQELQIDNRHIVLRTLDDGIVINVPQRMLFYFHSGNLLAGFPVGLGRRTWPTELGDFEVSEKEKDKTWIVPQSIQEEMVAKGKPLRKRVPPGPNNPLGKHWIRISPSSGIHGTNTPASIYRFRTHGCIRLKPEDIAGLYKKVSIGTAVKIVYQPVLLARMPDGKLYLEVHEDIYRKAGNPLETVKQMAELAGVESMVDWQKVSEVIKERRGLAQEVSLPAESVLRRNP